MRGLRRWLRECRLLHAQRRDLRRTRRRLADVDHWARWEREIEFSRREAEGWQ